jgi:hypothetical protein
MYSQGVKQPQQEMVLCANWIRTYYPIRAAAQTSDEASAGRRPAMHTLAQQRGMFTASLPLSAIPCSVLRSPCCVCSFFPFSKITNHSNQWPRMTRLLLRTSLNMGLRSGQRIGMWAFKSIQPGTWMSPPLASFRRHTPDDFTRVWNFMEV